MKRELIEPVIVICMVLMTLAGVMMKVFNDISDVFSIYSIVQDINK